MAHNSETENTGYEQLRNLGAEIDRALKKHDFELFNKLIKQRSATIQRLYSCSNGKPALSRQDLADLIKNNKRWIEKGRSLLEQTKSNLESLRELQETTENVKSVYHPIQSTGKYFSRNS